MAGIEFNAVHDWVTIIEVSDRLIPARILRSDFPEKANGLKRKKKQLNNERHFIA